MNFIRFRTVYYFSIRLVLEIENHMVKKFGTTWWGEQWLNSLMNIDYDNRLPRGARYARNGSVKSIDIKDGVIRARVAGSYPTPYKEVIEVPQFDKAKSKDFVDRLVSHPLIMASLMQRKLDPSVLKIAEESGLKVFPDSWKDLKMSCSCPDWAVPCKHLAAVIYKISEEIDNNPFMVFELHGLDLSAELKKRGLLTDNLVRNLDPADIGEYLKKTKAGKEKEEWRTPQIDLSKIPDVGDDLLELLADNPPFSIEGDFKKVYTKYIGTVAKSASKSLGCFVDDDEIEGFEAGCEVAFDLTADYKTKVELTRIGSEPEEISFADFVSRLSLIRPEDYLTSQPWVETMHKLYTLAVTLLSKKDIVPRILACGRSYRILWRPAVLHDTIKDIVNEAVGCVPVTAVRCTRGYVVENGGEWLLSLILNTVIAQICEVVNISDPLFDLFFLDRPQTFSGIGQGGVAGGIKVWTDKFFMSDDHYRLGLQVEEEKDGFAVGLSVSPEQEKGSVMVDMPFAKYMEDKSYSGSRLEVMASLSSLTDYMPGLRDYIIGGGKKPIRFTTVSFVPFLMKTLPLMRLLGVAVALPKSLRELVRPMVSVKIDRKAEGDGKSYVRLDELLTFDWEISLGDTLVSVDEFKKILRRAGELVKFKGRYIYATPEELEKLSKQLAKGGRLSSQEMLAIALSESYKDAPVSITKACRELLDRFRELPSLPSPAGLNATMRPYQLRGYEWMAHNLALGFGAVIADDMGLGKTLQVIAVLLYLKESGRLDKRKALVVVPTGLLTNWQKECARFAPSLGVSLYHGPSRDIEAFDGDILLTSYGVMRSDAAKLKKLKWELMVIDEAQNIKNTNTAQTKAVNSITASSHIAMSGTPVENRLSEYWSIMNYANKGLLGSLKEFNKQYGRPIQIEGNREAAERFKATTSPFMLRRLKSDKSIISDLPDKIERDEYASLTSDQAALYRKTLEAAMNEIEGVQGTDNTSLFKREGLVLQMIMALKQICNHPAQFLKTRQADSELSGKAMMLCDLVKGIVDGGEKVLIFTQFKEMGDLIVKMLDKLDISSMFYHGGCTLKKRNEMVERFQSQRSAQVFVLSLKAAGTGLNLTAATNVIHYDLWWNPAVEAQATDRAYRIGQHRNVQVYRFITKGTFEEKINAMIQDKKQLAELTVGTGEKWLAKMSDDELRTLFTLDATKEATPSKKSKKKV